MEALDRNERQKIKSHISDAANDLLNEGKKIAHDLYEEGLHKVNVTEEHLKLYSDRVEKAIIDKPLASILVAGGIGFLLSKIFSK